MSLGNQRMSLGGLKLLANGVGLLLVDGEVDIDGLFINVPVRDRVVQMCGEK